MRDLRLQLPQPMPALAPDQKLPLGQQMVDDGLITPRDLAYALNMQRYVDAPLGDVLGAQGLVSSAQVLQALARQHSAQFVDLEDAPPTPDLASDLPPSLCLEFQAVPWMRLGDLLFVATARPDRFDQLRARLGTRGARLLPVVAAPQQITRYINLLYGKQLARQASQRVPLAESCRSWSNSSRRRPLWALAALCAAGAALVAAPMWSLSVAMFWALLTLIMTTTLKAAAFCSQISHRPAPRVDTARYLDTPFRLPRVSVLVPLLREEEIAEKLVQRLSRLTYPKSQLEVVLVLEQSDSITRETIARTQLPDWMSVIEVPAWGTLTTKPRALNYALDFCKGSIIGVWDAEDAPQPDQIERIVMRFHEAPENVACLQGILDYYNPRQNWLARCFTIEYATWWRMVIPGIARLGLIVPLGGTTLFFRREILEKLCGWDAHNVTEDADLGVRLARHGYVTELVPTTTYEEANCRAWPWVRQRSRWLKGFLITWCVHMRQPRQLLRQVGLKRFLGLQTIFLATVSQFACAPLLWSFWLMLLGFTHPLEYTVGATTAWAMIVFFMLAEAINMTLSLMAVSGREHRHLLGYVPTTLFYYPLGMLAAYKAIFELILKPFYWDKTDHGIAQATAGAPPKLPSSEAPQWPLSGQMHPAENRPIAAQ
ncbi:MAG: glycosyltransferase family 2 protein [Sulfitobacter sp.]